MVICARIVVRYDYYQLNYYQPLVLINSVPSSIPTKLVLRNSNKSFKPNNYKLPNATFLQRKFMRNMIKQPIYKILYVQVIVAIVLGIALGHFPDIGESLKPLGDAFIKIVKMIIAPVIFLTVVTGISGMSNMKAVGSVAGKNDVVLHHFFNHCINYWSYYCQYHSPRLWPEY